MVWPFILTILISLSRPYIAGAALMVLAVGSAILSEKWAKLYPAASFYLMPSRLFEFVIGAACVWIAPATKGVTQVSFILGLCGIIIAAVGYGSTTRYPGIAALPPCFGAALIIYGRNSDVGGVVLGNAPMVFIGLISYSLYLVHWPVLVFYEYWTFRPRPTTS